MNDKIKKIIIATGGSGGHVYPAFSLASHFIDKKVDVRLISDKRGLKFLNNQSLIKTTLINSSTLFKKNILLKLLSLVSMFVALIKSIIFLIFFRPNLVFGMGGYSSFHTCIAAKILKIPFIIYENNLIIGKANKYLLPFATKIFISNSQLEGISKKFESKICVIGNILRKDIINHEPIINNKSNNDILKILVLGGSQAAKIFAERLPLIFKKCLGEKINLEVVQQCLPNQNKDLVKIYDNLKINYRIFNFSENMVELFSKTNLAITRAGSSILAELVNVKIPFIAVPLPTSADNHQLKNAFYYEKKGCGFLLEEKYLDEKLFNIIQEIHKNDSMLDKIKLSQGQYSDKSVYTNIEMEIKKIFDEKY